MESSREERLRTFKEYIRSDCQKYREESKKEFDCLFQKLMERANLTEEEKEKWKAHRKEAAAKAQMAVSIYNI